jgi:Protein of unknown function (DUF2480)
MNKAEDLIINKVANSGLIMLNLEDYLPKGERVLYDLKQNLFMNLILREKDFREFIKEHNWEQYSGKFVAITCTEDVLIPTWAYMLLTTKLKPFAKKIVFGNLEKLEESLFDEVLNKINISAFENGKIVIKGCSKEAVPLAAYLKITDLLMPVAQSIMFGEPCSTVPLYKKPKN